MPDSWIFLCRSMLEVGNLQSFVEDRTHFGAVSVQQSDQRDEIVGSMDRDCIMPLVGRHEEEPDTRWSLGLSLLL